jgi:hypothetical protein
VKISVVRHMSTREIGETERLDRHRSPAKRTPDQ